MKTIGTQSIQHSVPYWGVEHQLRCLAEQLDQLSEKIETFEPEDESLIRQRHENELTRLQGINRGKTPQELRDFFEPQLQTQLDQNFQIAMRFGKDYNALGASIVIMSAALCEGLINAVMAIGFTLNGYHEAFHLLEKTDIIEKWVSAPKLLEGKYQLPKDGALFEALRFTVKNRNILLHPKIELSIQNAAEKLLTPPQPNAFTFDRKGQKMLRRVCTLAYDLHRQLLDQVDDRSLKFHLENLVDYKGQKC